MGLAMRAGLKNDPLHIGRKIGFAGTIEIMRKLHEIGENGCFARILRDGWSGRGRGLWLPLARVASVNQGATDKNCQQSSGRQKFDVIHEEFYPSHAPPYAMILPDAGREKRCKFASREAHLTTASDPA